MKKISILDLFKTGAHFGHRTRFWHPKMQQYIYGKRNDIHIINLDETVEQFNKALEFVQKIAISRGKLMFVGTKRPAAKIIKAEASRCGMPYVDYRWLGGMLTNYKTIRQSIKKLLDLEAKVATGYFDKLNKKESLQLQREQNKLDRSLGGIKNIGGLPDALFVIDVRYEKIAIKEANRLKIPVIGIVDTNNNPAGIDYVIPGNDDSIKSIQLFCSIIADAILEANSKLATVVNE